MLLLHAILILSISSCLGSNFSSQNETITHLRYNVSNISKNYSSTILNTLNKARFRYSLAFKIYGSKSNAHGHHCGLSAKIISDIKSYQDDVNNIINFVMKGEYKGRTYKNVAKMVDTLGTRVVNM